MVEQRRSHIRTTLPDFLLAFVLRTRFCICWHGRALVFSSSAFCTIYICLGAMGWDTHLTHFCSYYYCYCLILHYRGFFAILTLGIGMGSHRLLALCN